MDFWKAVATVGIWLAITGIIISLMVTGAQAGWMVSMVALFVALAATARIWSGGETRSSGAFNAGARESLEKLKRGGGESDAKMRLLLEMMDDDERYAFKQAMKERMLRGGIDGELNYDANSLGALLDDDEYKRQRR